MEKEKEKESESGREYCSSEIILVADSCLEWITSGNAALTLLKSNGMKSPVAVISAANTGMTGVPCEMFCNKAYSYLVLISFESAKEEREERERRT